MGRVRRRTNISSQRNYQKQLRRHRQDFQALVSKIKPQHNATKYQLCDRCRKINFRSIFRSSEHSLSLYGEEVQVLDELIVDPACNVCQFIASFADNGHLDCSSQYQLRIYPGTVIFGAVDTEPNWQSQSIALAVAPKVSAWVDFDTISRKSGVILPFKPRTWENSHQFTFQGVLVNPRCVDYDLVLRWIAECDNHHQNTCILRAGNPVALRCIDCHQKEILKVVPIRKTDRYIALSYVWGVSAVAALRNEKSCFDSQPLSIKRVPQVVRDAMKVVSALGEQYLWVDLYCIEQQNHDSRDRQIKAMDFIYAGAYVTIIASAGSDASYGLPGVSRARKVSQRIGLTPAMQMISTAPPLPDCIENTKWNDRGWTYQEAVLSTRCLFFTEEQVHFLCPKMRRCESVLVQGIAIQPDREHDRMGHVLRRSPVHDNKTQVAFDVFADHIEHYSHRTLSYDDDILNAFRGILARSPFWTYYGVAITIEPKYISWAAPKDGNVGFANGLFWHAFEDYSSYTVLQRRPGFPSWSWAGWKGHVMYDYTSRSFDNDGRFPSVDQKSFNTKFWVADEIKGKLRTFKEMAIVAGTSMIMNELNSHLVIEAQVFRLRFQPDSEAYFGTCMCHLQPEHDDGVVQLSSLQGIVNFFEQLREKNSFYDRLVTETWDCIVLYRTKDGDWISLIVEWRGEIAEVVGNLRMKGCKQLEELATERRTIHMG